MSSQIDQSLVCPKCGEFIKLTESLAAPLVAATTAEYEKRLLTQAETFAAERNVLDNQQQANSRRATELDIAVKGQELRVARAVQDQVAQQLILDRKSITEQEKVRARQQVVDELSAQKAASEQLTDRIQILTQKLTSAQAVEAELLKKKQELEDKERELALNLQKGIAAGLERARAQALLEAQTGLELKMQDRERIISNLQDEIKNLQRKSEQGSQQGQGETLELILEDQLRSQFPFDRIEPVAKGEFGGDILQHVRDLTGRICGTILWESKRTKAWSDGWLTKLKNDQRIANADIAVLVSQTTPKGFAHFEQIDDIWVSSLGCVVPVASALRIMLIQITKVRRSSEGQETKAQQTYAYLTGPRFKSHVECIVEKFSGLRKDLDAERKWMNKQWSKRDKELTLVLETTSGMYGDLQGIAGRTLYEIDAMEGPILVGLDN